MKMKKYIITTEYFTKYQTILKGSAFTIGTVCTQDKDGTLHLTAMATLSADDSTDPVNPPQRPPILP